MEKNSFNITASSAEEFKNLEDMAKQLPDAVRSQIDTIEQWFHGIPRLVFKKAYGNTNKIALPANLTHLSDSGKEIHVNTPDLVISIPYDPGTLFQYEFVPVSITKEA